MKIAAFVVSLAAAPMVYAETPFLLGVCTHFSGGKGQLNQDLKLIQDAGFNSVREDLPWKEIERQKGTLSMPPAFDTIIDRIIGAGLKPLVILDYGNPFYDNGDKPTSDEAITAYGRYAEFVAHHFKGRVNMLEVWNEWGGTTGATHHGTPESYVKLLIPTYARIKAVDPTITVLGGAVSSQDLHGGWLKGMLNAGGISHVDGISIHTYTYYQEDPSKRTPDAWKAFVLETESDIRSITGKAGYPLYITEMGWPNDSGPKGTDPEMTADYFAQILLMGRTLPFLKGIWKYDFRDDGPNKQDSEHNFGLITFNSQPKPGLAAIKGISSVVKTASFEESKDLDPSMAGVKFKTADGRTGVAIWSRKASSDTTEVKVEKLGLDVKKAEVRSIRSNSAASEQTSRESTVKVASTPKLVLSSK
jgi:hypothetical protein